MIIIVHVSYCHLMITNIQELKCFMKPINYIVTCIKDILHTLTYVFCKYDMYGLICSLSEWLNGGKIALL